MYVQRLGQPHAQGPAGPRKEKAAALVGAGDFKMFGYAAAGIGQVGGGAGAPAAAGAGEAARAGAGAGTDAVFAAFGCSTEAQQRALLSVLGFWLRAPAVAAGTGVAFTLAAPTDEAWLVRQLAAVGVAASIGAVANADAGAHVETATVVAPPFVTAFAAAGMHVPGAGAGLPAWVWALGRDDARALLSGLAVASGDAGIVAPSAALRDDVVRLCLHAGYAARFHVVHAPSAVPHHHYQQQQQQAAEDVAWVVQYADPASMQDAGARAGAHGEPVLRAASDVQTVAYTGRTWCVTMPHGFLVARRACAIDGVVTKASMPVLAGNCSVDPIPDADVQFPVAFNGCNYQVYVRKRPYLDRFFQAIQGKFEVTIFTASQQVYAERLLNILDPERKYIE
jgi:hypothetical protein